MVGVAVVMFADRCTDYVDVKFSFEKEETKQLSCCLMLSLFLLLLSAAQALSFRGWNQGGRWEKRAEDEALQPGIWCKCRNHWHVCLLHQSA